MHKNLFLSISENLATHLRGHNKLNVVFAVAFVIFAGFLVFFIADSMKLRKAKNKK